MDLSNYEITKKNMAKRFLLYDQEKMIRKYGLQYDETYLYLEFFEEMYRIERKAGLVERFEKENFIREADFNEAMSLYDVLCSAKEDCHLAGSFCPTGSLKGITRTNGVLSGGSPSGEVEHFFDTHLAELKAACEKLGGIPEGNGDAAYRLRIFPFLPLRFQFWSSDEDFDAEIQFLWDENVLQYLHFETLYYVMGHLLKRLQELI